MQDEFIWRRKAGTKKEHAFNANSTNTVSACGRLFAKPVLEVRGKYETPNRCKECCSKVSKINHV